MDAERAKLEVEILRAEYARVDNERIRLEKELAEARQLLAEGAVPELQKQVTEARTVLKGIVGRVIAPLSKWRRGKAVIDGNMELLDDAVLEILLLGDPEASTLQVMSQVQPGTARPRPSASRRAARPR